MGLKISLLPLVTMRCVETRRGRATVWVGAVTYNSSDEEDMAASSQDSSWKPVSKGYTLVELGLSELSVIGTEFYLTSLWLLLIESRIEETRETNMILGLFEMQCLAKEA